MLRRIPSLFLNDARIYSDDAVLWHGVAGMSCFALPCFSIFRQQRYLFLSAVLTVLSVPVQILSTIIDTLNFIA